MNRSVGALTIAAMLAGVLAAEAAETPVPRVTRLVVPHSQRIERTDDFRGALLLANGGVYQVEEITWYITPDGRLTVRHFAGYDTDGQRIESSNTQEVGGRDVESFGKIGGFMLGRPDDADNYCRVREMKLGIDPSGYICILALNGTLEASKKVIAYKRDLAVLCGLRITTGCTLHGSCTTCGAYPGCPCTAGTGTCSGFSDTVCSGDCDAGQHCNGSVTSCSCVVNGPGTSPWGMGLLIAAIAATGVLVLRRRTRFSATA